MIAGMTRLAYSLALLMMALPVAAQDSQEVPPPPAPVFDEFRPLPLHEVARQVSDRYAGRLVAAEIRPPRPEERENGVSLVYEFRLVTPRRHMLLIRVDARDSRFLEVAGRGQIEALRSGARTSGKGPGRWDRGGE